MVTPDWTDDFNTDEFTDNHAANIGVDAATNERLDFDAKTDNTDDASSCDLANGSRVGSNLSDTAWVIRFKIRLTDITGGTNNNHLIILMSDSTTGIASSGANQDGLGTRLNGDPTDYSWVTHRTDGASGTGGVDSIFDNPTEGSDYYVEMTRLSATSFKVEFFSDSAFSTSVASATSTIASTIQNLQYFKVSNWKFSNSSVRDIIGYIDDLEVYDGITSLAQIARPNGDQSDGNWLNSAGNNTDMYSYIDEETASDSDYIESEESPTNSDCEVTLENLTDPSSSSGHIERYRYRKDISAGVIDITVYLVEGTTVIASNTHNGVGTSWADGSFTLSGTEADNITDYTDLRLRFRANESTSPSAQKGRPDSDIAAGGWIPSTGSTLYETIDEVTSSDSDYNETGNNPSADAMTVGLDNVTDPVVHTGHKLNYRYGGSVGARTLEIKVALMQGATVIHEETHSAVADGLHDGTFTLTTGEAGNITDYTDLRVRVTADVSGGGSPSKGQFAWAELEVPAVGAKGQISWAEFQVPEASGFTATQTLTIDVVVEEPQTQSLTIDVVIEESQNTTFTIDIIIEDSATQTFTIDTIIQEVQTATFTIDIIIEDIGTQTFTIDTHIITQPTQTFTIDVIIEEVRTETFTIDTIIEQIQTSTFTIDVVIQDTATQTFTIDTVIEEVRTATFTIDVVIQDTATQTFTIDTYIEDPAQSTQTFTIDTVIEDTATQTFTIDVIIEEVRTSTFTIDTVIQGVQSSTFTIDVVIQDSASSTFTIDVVVEESQTQTFTIDVIIEEVQTATFTIDVVIQDIATQTFTIDTVIEDPAVATQTFTIDTVIEDTATQTFTIDIIIQEIQTSTFTIDTIIEEIQTSTFTIDTHIVTQPSQTFTIDVVIQETQTSTFTIDVYITEPTTTKLTKTVDAVSPIQQVDSQSPIQQVDSQSPIQQVDSQSPIQQVDSLSFNNEVDAIATSDSEDI